MKTKDLCEEVWRGKQKMAELDKFQLRKQEALKRKQQLKKMQNAKIRPATKKKIMAGVAVLLALVIVGTIVFFNAGFVRRQVNAMTVGEEKVSATEFNYYYAQQAISTYNTYYQYFGGSYVPFDTSKKLSSQKYSDDQTWADYFTDSSVNTIQKVKTLLQAGKEAGYTLSAKGQETVDAAMVNLATYASNAKMSLNSYLSKVYGRGMNADLMRKVLTESQYAGEYDDQIYSSFEYTDEQVSDYFDNKVKDSYTYVDLYYYAFNSSAATETKAEVTLEDAKKAAEIVAAASSEKDFVEKLKAYMATLVEEGKEVADPTPRTQMTKASLNSVDEKLAEWAYAADRKAGDIAVVEKADGKGYFAVCMQSEKPYRQEYNTVNLREVYVAIEKEDDEAADTAAKEKAEQLLADWKKAEATEETFAAMADEVNAGSSLEGGLISRATKSDDELSDWAFDAARKAGDTVVLKNGQGYYILYFVGEDLPLWQVQTISALRSADYDEAYTKLTEKYAVSRDGFGLFFREEPFLN